MNVSNIKHCSSRQGGFSFIEVMIGVFIFAVGMLALALLQGSLTRSQADANQRATASALAEQVIERTIGFAQETTDATGTLPAYEDIQNSTVTVTPGGAGIPYTITLDVLDYRWDGDSFECFSADSSAGTSNASDARCVTGTVPPGSNSDFKLVEVTVSWAGGEFLRQDGVAASNDRLGSGSVTLSTVVSSVASPASGRVQTGSDFPRLVPPITYTPGQNPEVVSLALGDNKFKESTTPLPKIIRGDFIETNWDVVTYSVTGDASTFLRREEFRAVNCECSFNAASGDNPTAQPYVWGGDEYVTGDPVAKPYGSVVQGSPLCDRCCANHHDSTGPNGALDTRFTPFRSDYNGNNHSHYNFNNQGQLVEVTSGNYLESCRMVRVDGFWVVGQDLRSEERFVFPEDFLTETEELATYSNYLTGSGGSVPEFLDAVMAENSGYPATVPCLGADFASCLTTPSYDGGYPDTPEAGEFPSWTSIVYAGNDSVNQQLRSRALFIDPISSDLMALIDCLDGADEVADLADNCLVNGKPGVGKAVLDRGVTFNALELTPFFEVQLTEINDWTESPINDPLDVISQQISNNDYVRGVTTSKATGTADAVISMLRDNSGLIGSIRYLPLAQEPVVTCQPGSTHPG